MAKKATKKSAAKKSTTSKVDAAIKLMKRANGATLADFAEIGFNQPAMAAVKAAERRGMKVEVKKEEGARTKYIARA